jgi:hypothetical protein
MGLIVTMTCADEVRREKSRFSRPVILRVFPHNQLGANTSEDKKIVPSYGFCDHWNCADDECDEDRKNYEREIAE